MASSTAWASSGARIRERLPGDAGEIVRDLAQITRAGVDEREGDEANEAASPNWWNSCASACRWCSRNSARCASRRAPRPSGAAAALELGYMPDKMAEEFARRRRQLMRLMGRDAIAMLPAAPERTRNNDVVLQLPPGQRLPLPHRLRRARGGRGAGARAAAGRIRPVRARAQRASARSGTAGAPGRTGARRALRRRRRLSDRRSRRDPARPAGEPRARVPHHGQVSRLRPARGRLGQRAARPGARRRAPAAGIRGARSRAARHAPVQEPRRAGDHAPVGRDRRRRRTCAPCGSAGPGAPNTR